MLLSRFRQFGRAVGQAQRLRHIVGVFLKYGYDDIAARLPLPRVWRWLPTSRFKREHAAIAALPRQERLKLVFEELGPAFVKLGQLLAGRTRLLPRSYTLELAKLQDHVAPVPYPAVLAVIAEELSRPPTECFAAIDETPLGAASMAQVHRARLPDGAEVVVKVQRPGIEPILRTDLEIMGRIATLLETHVEEWQPHHPAAIVAEFARRVEHELDFAAELAAMERFARQFEGDATVHVPRVYRALSTGRLLTMEYIAGTPASHLAVLDAAGLDRALIARRLADLTLRQIFVHGFFHGDPHPGNVHILPGNVVCFLDFGLTGFLIRETRDQVAALLVAVAQRDERAGTQALLVLAGAELGAPRPGLEADVAEFIHRHFTGPVRELVFMRLLQHLLQITARHDLALPPEVFTVIKALGQIEHLVSELAPDLDLLEQAKPFVREVHTRRVGPRRVLRELLDFGGETVTALRTLPLEFRRVAAQLRDGRAKVNFRVEGLRPLNETLERVTNRLAFAIVLAALLVASALVIRANVGPIWHGVSIIGLAGYVAAGFMGLLLLISIVRHGRM
ncbi:MAG: phosphotransferase [Opitutaceae bacterium]|nr:phosphotransferase [Opitutaceae bacterium]